MQHRLNNIDNIYLKTSILRLNYNWYIKKTNKIQTKSHEY